jgi:hypothetical protein
MQPLGSNQMQPAERKEVTGIFNAYNVAEHSQQD